MLNIVIPMAGKGSRFLQKGFLTPKPFIQVNGKPLIYWAMKSIDPLIANKQFRLYFVINQKLDKNPYKEYLRTLSPNAEVTVLKSLTGGQAETVFHLQEKIDTDVPLLVYNCDTYTLVNNFFKQVKNSDGGVVLFPSSNPSYSYAKIQGDKIIELVEKQVVSDYATSGLYYFSKGSDFIRTARYVIRNKIKSRGEFFVAPLYNLLISENKKISPIFAEKVYMFGTPEELLSFSKIKENL